MLFAPVLASGDDETKTISFLIFGATPKEVMEDLVSVSSYVVADPDFLILDLAPPRGPLEAVRFDTSNGPVVELRVPLPMARITDAIKLLAGKASALPKAEVHYATEIIDEEGLFIIQRIEADGILAEPRRVYIA